jgi:hypothetical protein
MITGYVYSAPGEIMATSPGVLLLRDCLEQCRLNDSCRAINFETGLCVLFAGSYADQPGTLILICFSDKSVVEMLIYLTYSMRRDVGRPLHYFCLKYMKQDIEIGTVVNVS